MMKYKSQSSVASVFMMLIIIVEGCSKDNTPDPLPLPVLTTNEVSKLTHIHAVSGGKVTDAGGLTVLSAGICWSTSQQPTTNDSKTSDFYQNTGTFLSYFTGLSPNTSYYLRAYTSTDAGTAYGNQIQFTTFPDYTGITGNVSDNDGNVYKTVGIGSQTWMAENLKTTTYNDGTLIPNVSTDQSWTALTSAGYCIYENNVANKAVYGNLYNWYTINSTGNGNKNVCPAGWHVPTDADWATLTSYVGETASGEWSWDTEWEALNLAGKILKESGTVHWRSPNPGTDAVGFKALPGGFRHQNGFFDALGRTGLWWSSSTYDGSQGRFVTVDFASESGFFTENWDRTIGLSVRCVKN
jgi:uncharacterized protein (TIGR02145 family)